MPSPSVGRDGVQQLNPLEIPDWDEQVGRLPGATFFHGRAWAEVLHASYGYRPCYMACTGGGRVRSLIALMEVNSWLTGRRGVGLPFTDGCAPLVSQPSDFDELRQAAWAHGLARNWKYLESRGGRENFGDAPVSTGFWHHELNLQHSENELFQRCDSSVRRAIRKAERSDLILSIGRDAEAIRSFYQLLCVTRKRHGLPVQPFGFFAAIKEKVLQREQGIVVLARSGGRPVAGAVFFHFGRQAIYKYGASDEAHQELRANNLVMWRAIKWHLERGYHGLDFGRTSDYNLGLRRFKQGWGTMERRLEYVRWEIPSARFVTVPDSAAGWHNRVFRNMPSSLSRLAGCLLYRHVA